MKRLGASVGLGSRIFHDGRKSFSRAVREVFVRLYEEGLIYRGKLYCELVSAMRDGDFGPWK